MRRRPAAARVPLCFLALTEDQPSTLTDAAEEAPIDDDDDMEAEVEDDDALDPEALIAEGRDQDEGASAASSSPLPPVLEAFLTTLNLPLRLLALSTPATLSFLPLNLSAQPPVSLPSPHPPTTALLSTIHLRALEALNNLLVSTSFFIPAPTSPSFSTPEWQSFFVQARALLQPVWEQLFAIAGAVAPAADVLEAKGQEVRKELLDTVMSCLMGVAAITRGSIALAPGQLEQLLAAHQGTTRESLRTRVLSTLGSLAQNDVSVSAQTIEINKVRRPAVPSPAPVALALALTRHRRLLAQTIGTYLLNLLTAPAGISPESMVVVLNAVFDTYADENSAWDAAVFRQGNFLPALKVTVTKVRGIVRSPHSPPLASLPASRARVVLTPAIRTSPRHRRARSTSARTPSSARAPTRPTTT